MIENATLPKPAPVGEVLRSAGYAVKTSQGKPKQIVETEGVQQALAELGFTTENAKKAVGKILNDDLLLTTKPEAVVSAAREVFKVNGDYAAEKHVIGGAVSLIPMTPEKFRQVSPKIKQYEDELLEEMTK